MRITQPSPPSSTHLSASVLSGIENHNARAKIYQTPGPVEGPVTAAAAGRARRDSGIIAASTGRPPTPTRAASMASRLPIPPPYLPMQTEQRSQGGWALNQNATTPPASDGSDGGTSGGGTDGAYFPAAGGPDAETKTSILERRLQKAISANTKWKQKYDVEARVSQVPSASC